MTSAITNYDSGDITVLEGLEAVRRRPGMYIGSTGPRGLHHLVYEVVDNSVDEALAGYCDRVEITLNPDGSCTVVDNGRGIPVSAMADQGGRSALEVVMTVLHAGGKFGGDGYKVSGGLHGVGISVVNALSESLVAEVRRDGGVFEQRFARGRAARARSSAPATPRTPGTTITFLPDPDIFEEPDFDFETLAQRLRETAFLTRGLVVRLVDRARRGPRGRVPLRGRHPRLRPPPQRDPRRRSTATWSSSRSRAPEGASRSRCSGPRPTARPSTPSRTTSTRTRAAPTSPGSAPPSRARSTTTRAPRGCSRRRTTTSRARTRARASRRSSRVKLREPQFEGQTKTKLGNSEITGFVNAAVTQRLAEYLEEHPAEARAICGKAINAAQARQAARKARDLARRKGAMDSTNLPGKLADCSDRDPEQHRAVPGRGRLGRRLGDHGPPVELPGDPAPARQDHQRREGPHRQGPLQRRDPGHDHGDGHRHRRGLRRSTKARYHKLIIMTDADVDGAHIRTLILTFLFRHMRGLIEEGFVYIACPPLYKVKQGNQEQYIEKEPELEDWLLERNLGDLGLEDAAGNANGLTRARYQRFQRALKEHEAWAGNLRGTFGARDDRVPAGPRPGRGRAGGPRGPRPRGRRGVRRAGRADRRGRRPGRPGAARALGADAHRRGAHGQRSRSRSSARASSRACGARGPGCASWSARPPSALTRGARSRTAGHLRGPADARCSSCAARACS